MFKAETQHQFRRIVRTIIAIPVAAGIVEFLARTLFWYSVIMHGVLFEGDPAPSAGDMGGYALHSLLYPLLAPLSLVYGGNSHTPLLLDLLDNWWIPEWEIAMLAAWYIVGAAVVIVGWCKVR